MVLAGDLSLKCRASARLAATAEALSLAPGEPMTES